jgi:hypothetical protein
MRIATLLLVLVGTSACQSAQALEHAATTQDVVSVDMGATCVRGVTALLRQDLLQVVSGRPDGGQDIQAQLEKVLGRDSEVVQRIDRVHAMVLETATGDILGTFDRHVEQEVAAYQPRILIGCAG